MEDWGSWLVEGMSSLTVVSVVFSTVLAYLLWAIADRWVLHRGRKGPVQWPILGATVEILRNFHQLNDWTVFYFLRDGLTFGCKTANVNYIFTADPANVEYILKTNFANYPKGKLFHENFELFLGDGIFNVDGESWKQQRKTASFEFASRKLRDFSTVIFRDYSVKVALIITNACMMQHPLDMQGKTNLFSRFMLLNKEQGEHRFTDKNFRDSLLSFTASGRDTTAVTLSWFVYMITVHPHVGDKIFEELLALEMEIQAVNPKSESQTLGEEGDFNQRILQFSEILTFDSLLKLHYLHACIMETLRLYPPVPVNGKCAAADDVLPDRTAVKKGFFLGDEQGSQSTLAFVDGVVHPESPFRFATFQAGPWTCLGRDSAILQMRIMCLALLCHFFKFQLEPDCVVKYCVMATLMVAKSIPLWLCLPGRDTIGRARKQNRLCHGRQIFKHLARGKWPLFLQLPVPGETC